MGVFYRNGTKVVSYVYDSWEKLISTSDSLTDTIGAQTHFATVVIAMTKREVFTTRKAGSMPPKFRRDVHIQ